MQQDTEFYEAKRALEALQAWNGQSKLKNGSYERIYSIIRQDNLRLIPIPGVAALFGCSIVTVRGYVDDGLIEPIFHYLGRAFFLTSDVRAARDFRKQVKRPGITNKEVARMFKQYRHKVA